MASKTRKISTLIENQLPGFISSEYENFSKFVEKYYEQLENQGQPLDIINNITKYRDIDFYEENLLKQYTTLSTNLNSSDTTIAVADASSFPRKNGYVRIGDEICFYQERTETELRSVSRGVSGNTTLGDLYTKSEFVTTEAASHFAEEEVYNVSNLFLYAFVKSFESQYLDSFPEKYLKGEVDKRTLIKNISKFYKAKGTDKSIKFIFNSIVSRTANDIPEVLYPKDSTIRPSTSDWVSTYSLKVKILSGSPENLIGEKLEQLPDPTNFDVKYASGFIDNLVYKGNDVYEIVLDPATVNGTFNVVAKTKLTSPFDNTKTVGDRIDVGSTMGWKLSGNLLIDTEQFTFEDKNVNQFIIASRSSSQSHLAGADVYGIFSVKAKQTTFLILGVLYNLNLNTPAPFSELGDKIEISNPGVESNSPVVFDTRTSSVRWLINESNTRPLVFDNPEVQSAISNLNADVSAIYEDNQYFYICSSSYPSHQILDSSVSELLKDQKILRLIRKTPVTTTEIYETPARDVGILVNGVPVYGCKDEEYVLYGNIVTSEITYKGSGYKNPPYVLIDEIPGKATANVSGEVLESIVINTDEIYAATPTVTITAGRGARARAIVTNGQITDIVVIDPGEYYSTAPTVRIIDIAGKGNFAEYKSQISENGQVVGFEAINVGKFYTQANVQLELIEDAQGTEATAKVEIKKWYKNRVTKYSEVLDESYGYVFSDFASKDKAEKTLGYGCVGNPRRLRLQLNDNLTTILAETSVKQHSPIVGFAYDGNPIYGPFGYSNPLNPNSSIIRMISGYDMLGSRLGGPSTSQYPLGTFVDDYKWYARASTGKSYLDENNGRFCVTPDYPEGTYAYFLTMTQLGASVFPYVLGKNYYSLPVDSNYNSNISQNDVPVNSRRLRTASIESNGSNTLVKINNVSPGNVSGIDIQDSVNTFKVGSFVRVDDTNTGGQGATALVSEVKGISVTGIDCVQNKVLDISLVENAFLYDGDIITQNGSNATGEIVGNVVSSNQIILRNVSGVFNTSNVLSGSIRVVNVLVDKNSNYTANSPIVQVNNSNLIIAEGVVVETITRQNTVKIRIVSGQFEVNNNYVLKSSNLSDTIGSKIVTVNSLSTNLQINSIDDNIAIVNTDDNHNLTVGDNITVDIVPDDTQTQTTYFVRKRIYQRIKLNIPTINSNIDDTGVGSFEYLNGGADYQTGQYTNVELIFKDSTKIRSSVGAPGNPNNARATVVVSNINGSNRGRVTSVIITNKGSQYKKGDILTVSDASLNRLGNTISTQRLIILVDHAGFSRLNNTVKLTNVIGLSTDDQIQIGSEILKITNINTTTKVVSVLRGQNFTDVVDHYNNQFVTLYDNQYRFNYATQILGQTSSDPYVFDYDRNTQLLTLVYTYGANNINVAEKENVFYDNSTPRKTVTVSSVELPESEFQFSKINTDSEFKANPVIEVTKYYKYKFDTSHFSMVGTYLDFSPSLSYNINPIEVKSTPVEPGQGGAEVIVRFGYSNSSYVTNENTKIEKTNYLKYYYFDKSKSLKVKSGYLNIIDDPLQGEKTVYYATDDKFVYQIDKKPQYDGSGSISYTTSSKFAIGPINKVALENLGENYLRVPIVTGVDIAEENKAIVQTRYNIINKSIDFVTVLDGGNNYSKPKAVVVNGDGYGAEFSVFFRDGKVLQVDVISGGKNYTYPPTVEIIESDVKMYFQSENIGIPRTVQIINNGVDYHLDNTLISNYTSNLVFLLKNHDDHAFFIGEKVAQTAIVNGIVVETASGIVSKNGWRPGSNILRLEKITGSFDSKIQIKGLVKKSTADIISILNAEFDSDVRGYYDNIGTFNSDRGHLSSNTQRITDSYYYQDYSYVIKSKTPTNVWRDLIKQTTHPAGFKLFGEVLVESKGNADMPSGEYTKTERINIINLSSKLVELKNIKRNITQSILKFNDLNVEKGLGSVALDIDANSETVAIELILATPFNGNYDSYNGQLIGTTTFVLLEKKSNLPYSPYNNQQLIITLDGVMQEPGVAYNIVGNQITFAEPPFGQRIVDGQIVSGQKFYCRSICFKNNDLNAKYLKKLKSLSTEFDGINTVFDLYYENGDIVKTDHRENLLVALNGVLQKSREFVNIPFGNSYHILRNPNPNITDKIEFSYPPTNHEDLYENINTELNGAEKCFIYSLGNYKRLTIDSRQIFAKPNGPFLLYNEVSKSVENVQDTRYALVYIDGVLQIEGESYEIVGSTIIFKKPLTYYIAESGENVLPDVSLILFYGRDLAQNLTMFDFEPDQYFNIVTFNLQGTNIFQTIKNLEVLPNKMLSTQNIWLYQNDYLLGELKEIKAISNNEVELTIVSSTNLISRQINNDNVTFLINKIDVKDIVGTYNITYSYSADEDGNRLLKSKANCPIWLYNTKLGEDREEIKRYRKISNIVPGDLIKIDGENEYRQVFSVPFEAKTRNFLEGEVASQEIYAKISCSNYNGITRGEGLSINAKIFGGEVVSLQWNKRELELFFANDILVQPTAYQYYTNPIIKFIPTDGNGGGARAEVIICNDQILDVVLLDGGSGYTEKPKVVVSRKFSIVKKNSRKIQSHLALLQIIPKLKLNFSIISQIELLPDDVTYIFEFLYLGQNFDIATDIINHIWPKSVNTGIVKSEPTKVTVVVSTIKSFNSIVTTKINITNRLEIPVKNISIEKISKNVAKIAYLGTVDKLNGNNYSAGHFSQNIVGNRLAVFEIAKFIDTGYSGVSRLTIEEFSIIYPNSVVQDFDEPNTIKITSNPRNVFNLGYSSIQEFGALLDIQLTSTDTIIYTSDTRRFPTQGKLLIGKEIITYTSKLSDRFLGVARGVNGTTPASYSAGQYLRTTT
jgi:hypothetical protein